MHGIDRTAERRSSALADRQGQGQDGATEANVPTIMDAGYRERLESVRTKSHGFPVRAAEGRRGGGDEKAITSPTSARRWPFRVR